jgi:hypothetical protein
MAIRAQPGDNSGCRHKTPTIVAIRNLIGHRVYIHSSKGMTRAEYERAADFMAKIGPRCPAPDELARGGIIGSVLVVGIVTAHRSRWFRGPYALVFADPRPGPFRSALDQVGLFTP